MTLRNTLLGNSARSRLSTTVPCKDCGVPPSPEASSTIVVTGCTLEISNGCRPSGPFTATATSAGATGHSMYRTVQAFEAYLRHLSRDCLRGQSGTFVLSACLPLALRRLCILQCHVHATFSVHTQMKPVCTAIEVHTNILAPLHSYLMSSQ